MQLQSYHLFLLPRSYCITIALREKDLIALYRPVNLRLPWYDGTVISLDLDCCMISHLYLLESVSISLFLWLNCCIISIRRKSVAVLRHLWDCLLILCTDQNESRLSSDWNSTSVNNEEKVLFETVWRISSVQTFIGLFIFLNPHVGLFSIIVLSKPLRFNNDHTPLHLITIFTQQFPFWVLMGR